MSKLKNQLTIIKLLENGIVTKGKDIAIELGVSDRMVRTYIQELIEAGIEIVTCKSSKGGYKIVGEYAKKKPIKITDIITLSDVSEIYNINRETVKSNFRKLEYKLIENVDYRKTKKVTLLTRQGANKIFKKVGE